MGTTVCYPFFRTNIADSMGGSFESTYLMASALPSDIESQVVLSGEGRASTRAREYGLDTDILPYDPMFEGCLKNLTPLPRKIGYGAFLPGYFFRVVRYLRQSPTDIVHLSDPITAAIWGSAARLLGIPVIRHIRAEYLPNHQIRLLSHLSSHLVFVAESNRERFEGTISNRIPSSVVYNGVDTERFTPDRDRTVRTELEVGEEEFLVGFVGNLVDRKRPMLFANAAIELLAARDDCHFVLAGTDAGGYRERIEALAADNGVESRISVLGFRDDIEHVMASLDILALTSTKHGEAFPRTPLEAMAAGTPVVTTDSAGVSEAVVHEETGFVLPADATSAEIADHIATLLDDQELYETFATAARRRMTDVFSAEEVAARVADIYRQYV
jgi:glycosyltransferase involved in cell wall biosynthesis